MTILISVNRDMWRKIEKVMEKEEERVRWERYAGHAGIRSIAARNAFSRDIGMQ
jgi:ribonuclease HI